MIEVAQAKVHSRPKGEGRRDVGRCRQGRVLPQDEIESARRH